MLYIYAKFCPTHMDLFEATKSTSDYKEISWNKERKRWQVEFEFNGKKCQYYFENKFDAIKTRNRVYKKIKISSQDPESCELTNQQVTHIQINSSLMTLILYVLVYVTQKCCF